MNDFAGRPHENPLDLLQETCAVLAFLNDVSCTCAPGRLGGTGWQLSDDGLQGQYLILERCRIVLTDAANTVAARLSAADLTGRPNAL